MRDHLQPQWADGAASADEPQGPYFHGGPAGRQVGAFLLPPSATRARSLAEFGAAGVCRLDRVYVTTDRHAALLYAAAHRRGVIYEVEPIGTLDPDPDCAITGLSWQCERARVLRVIKPKPGHLLVARRALVAS